MPEKQSNQPSREELRRRLRSKVKNLRHGKNIPTQKVDSVPQFQNLDGFGFNDEIKKQGLNKIKELSKKFGNITEKDYQISLKRLEKNKYKNQAQKIEDTYTVKLYKDKSKNLKELNNHPLETKLEDELELQIDETDEDSISSNLSE